VIDLSCGDVIERLPIDNLYALIDCPIKDILNVWAAEYGAFMDLWWPPVSSYGGNINTLYDRALNYFDRKIGTFPDKIEISLDFMEATMNFVW